MVKYFFLLCVSCIDGNTKANRNLVLNDNHFFQSTVQNYKHVVTNLLSSKIEIWYKMFYEKCSQYCTFNDNTIIYILSWGNILISQQMRKLVMISV